MSAKALAQHYLRYWSVTIDGIPVLADNAPREIWQFVLAQPKETDLKLVRESLEGLATGKFPASPNKTGLLKWFASYPEAATRCDEALAGKNPPKSLENLLKNAYLAEVQRIRTRVTEWLQAQIDQY